MKKEKILLTGLTAASILFGATAANAELFKLEGVKFAKAETTPAATTPPAEGNCGKAMMKEKDGKCGKDAKASHKKNTVKEKDGKCGEGTCGSANTKAPTTPTPAPTEVKANKADDSGQSGY